MPPTLPVLERNWALFLDIDGTLIDIAATPWAVQVPATLPATLVGLLAGLDGAVALISGRSIAMIDKLFAPLRLPAAGQHGAEIRRADGLIETVIDNDPTIDRLAARLDALALALPGVLIEHKGLSIAAHYREAPEHRDVLYREILDFLREAPSGIDLLEGRSVFDLRLRGTTKGSAVHRFLEEAPFAGRHPVFIGDDTTDEDGFKAALDLGGDAILVGARDDSVAPYRIDSPAALRDWLARSLAAF